MELKTGAPLWRSIVELEGEDFQPGLLECPVTI